MDFSDAWVGAGCRPDDRLLDNERLALAAPYTGLLRALRRTGSS